MRKPPVHLINPDGTHSDLCFPCKLESIQFAPSAMPSRRGGQAASDAKTGDKALGKDRDAYRDLRRDGLQPKSVLGAHQLATRANERFEVNTGRIVEDDSLRQRSAVAFAEMPKPSADPIVREDA